MFDFQKLIVYQKARSFHFSCRKLINQKKMERPFNDQLGRAALSIPLNIAEGCAKYSAADRKNFYVIARASLFECVALLEILSDEGVISVAELKDLMGQADQLSRILFSLIQNLSTKPLPHSG